MARSYRKHTNRPISPKVTKAITKQSHKKVRQAPIEADVTAIYKVAKGLKEYAV